MQGYPHQMWLYSAHMAVEQWTWHEDQTGALHRRTAGPCLQSSDALEGAKGLRQTSEVIVTAATDFGRSCPRLVEVVVLQEMCVFGGGKGAYGNVTEELFCSVYCCSAALGLAA